MSNTSNTTSGDQAVQTFSDFLNDRMQEASSKVGMAGVGYSLSLAGQAAISGLAGDYVNAALYGIPAIYGLYKSAQAIWTPENKGLTNDQITSMVKNSTRQHLFDFLLSSASNHGLQPTNTSVNTVGNRPSGPSQFGTATGAIDKTS